jgi:hypothetical protein
MSDIDFGWLFEPYVEKYRTRMIQETHLAMNISSRTGEEAAGILERVAKESKGTPWTMLQLLQLELYFMMRQEVCNAQGQAPKTGTPGTRHKQRGLTNKLYRAII